ncbi:DUF4238 domain-containing protein [Rhizobium rhizogenes]|uniref:DUF4238 domain-containing protein n=1 Tax=Rhizobium rhizogenes TaxID=359 RepID=UPI0005AB90E0|nr:DUF4238 domain-containing protein [Rhizobium rhizogenes]NTG71459.1 DUF4238 domain-containing protein [Rhizobium rhizogenes]NTG91077.1 DUF4238 domain-containing protein [Rhizobium rhizogenes]TRB03383.1 DUF4238 domain-containing protein [Rhizobium rhizogenes]TRB38125.1 DUF4238 domain-containing protein [Rhizobium rhizogenes]TRB53136.1 DUF4238 domain-containing protein [Rhizobium rhizogenes]
MSERTKRQHVVPRFYLRHFTQSDGELWTHDSVTGTVRKSTPEKTAFETNIYTPTGEDGGRIDLIEDTLAKIESQAATIYPDLLAFRPLDPVAKLDFAAFLGTMFARSPAQLRQFARTMGQMFLWGGRHEMDRDFREKEKQGEVSTVDRAVHKILHDNEMFTVDVDRRVGLLAFQQAKPLMDLMSQMSWSYEISENQQLATSDNPVFWVKGGGPSDPRGYGFGLGNPFAVIPFPLSPGVILRLDWRRDGAWKKAKLERRRAMLANQYQAKHKERLLFFRDTDQGLCSLAMKYKAPVNQIDLGVPSPIIDVVRKLKAP